MANLKSSRVVLLPTHSELEQELLAKIEALLAGRLSADEAGDWAIERLYVDDVAASDRALSTSGLRHLIMAKHLPAEMTAALQQIQAALKGEIEYAVSVTELSSEEIERRRPGALAPEEELVRQWPSYAKYLRQGP